MSSICDSGRERSRELSGMREKDFTLPLRFLGSRCREVRRDPAFHHGLGSRILPLRCARKLRRALFFLPGCTALTQAFPPPALVAHEPSCLPPSHAHLTLTSHLTPPPPPRPQGPTAAFSPWLLCRRSCRSLCLGCPVSLCLPGYAQLTQQGRTQILPGRSRGINYSSRRPASAGSPYPSLPPCYSAL